MGDANDAAVAAAVALLREDGPAAVTMPAVAARCGVSVRRLYRQFASRDDLVRAALRVVLEDVRPVVPAGIESLPAAARALADDVDARPDVATLLLDPGIDARFAELFGYEHFARVRDLDPDIAPVLVFLSSPHAAARIAATCGCARTDAVDAIVVALQRLCSGANAPSPRLRRWHAAYLWRVHGNEA
jgi:AcrR family transcriptional regulator